MTPGDPLSKDIMEHEYEHTGSALDRAIEQWTHGWTIPLTLAAELIEEGYNVAALEAHYRA